MGRYAPGWADSSIKSSTPLQMQSMDSFKSANFSSLGDTTPKQSMFNLNQGGTANTGYPGNTPRQPSVSSSIGKGVKGGLVTAGLGAAGGLAGGFLGSKIGGLFGEKGKDIGSKIGAGLGTIAGFVGSKALGFKKGGRVKRTGKSLVHKGEFILPKGIKPTKNQIKKVRKRGGRV